MPPQRTSPTWLTSTLWYVAVVLILVWTIVALFSR
jgi:hypothetical protein